MTVAVATSKILYAPAGPTTGPFTFNFEIYTESDLRVVKRSSAGVDSVLALNTDYTVSAGPWTSGGTITTTIDVESGEKILLKLALAATQGKDLPTNGIFPAEDVEQALDRNTKLTQQVIEVLSRCIQLQESSTKDVGIQTDPTASGDVLVWNGTTFSFGNISTLTPASVVLSALGQLIVTSASTHIARKNIDVGELTRSIPGGRLAAHISDPLGEDGGVGIATLYYHPYRSDHISIYNDGESKWVDQRFASASLAMAGLTDNMPYDVFAVSGGASLITLEGESWASDTVRNVALTKLDGTYVKSTDYSRLYIGTGYKFAGSAYDYNNLRYLWNMYNRVVKPAYLREDSDLFWTYSTTTFRRRNGYSSAIDRVCGLADEDTVIMDINGRFFSSGATFRQSAVGIGIDSTTVNSATVTCPATMNNTSYGAYSAHLRAKGLLGRHRYYPLEKGGGADTQTHQGVTGDFATGLVAALEC